MLVEIQLNDGSAVFCKHYSVDMETKDVTVVGPAAQSMRGNCMYWPVETAFIRSKLIGYLAVMKEETVQDHPSYKNILHLLQTGKWPEEAKEEAE